MTTQTEKQELRVVTVNLTYPKTLGRQLCWRIDEALTWIFCTRVVCQIEPGKFEEIDLKKSNRPETSRHWRGLN